MGVQTVEGGTTVTAAAASASAPTHPTHGGHTAAFNDVEKGNIHWGKNMQRWRNDNIDIAKGS